MSYFQRLFIGTLAASLVFTACGTSSSTPTPITKTDALLVRFVVEGHAQPQWTLDLAFGVSGTVTEVLVSDDDTVVAGQVLARLGDNALAQAEVARAKQEMLAAQMALDTIHNHAALTVAQAQLAELTAQQNLTDARQQVEDLKQTQADAPQDTRPTDLQIAQAKAEATVAEIEWTNARAYRIAVEKAGLDPEGLAAAQARLATAEAALVSAQANFKALELVAPHAGTVTGLTLKVGQRLTAGQVALTLADFSEWEVMTDNLTELQVVAVTEGETVTVIADALPDVTLSGSVKHINARFEEKRGDITYTLTLHLIDPDSRLRWGMTVAAQFEP